MSENYSWMLSDHKDAWINRRAGVLPVGEFWNAITQHGTRAYIFIYDEWQNDLLYIIPDADPMFRKLAKQINQKYKVGDKLFADPFASGGELFREVMHRLMNQDYDRFHDALELAERKIIVHAKYLKRRNK